MMCLCRHDRNLYQHMSCVIYRCWYMCWQHQCNHDIHVCQHMYQHMYSIHDNIYMWDTRVWCTCVDTCVDIHVYHDDTCICCHVCYACVDTCVDIHVYHDDTCICCHVCYTCVETCVIYMCWHMCWHMCCYGVATWSRLLQFIGLFCKRALWKRRYSAKETYNFKEPTNRSHPIHVLLSLDRLRGKYKEDELVEKEREEAIGECRRGISVSDELVAVCVWG